jgi:hypothetical protein
MKELLLADDLDQVRHRLLAGHDPESPLDERGAGALFYACTPAMLQMLLEAGARPDRLLADGISALDAAAREGQTEMVRLLLQRAPELATEARAMLAVSHPETQALLRAVARGESASALPQRHAAPLQVHPVPEDAGPGLPLRKDAQRFHRPQAGVLPGPLGSWLELAGGQPRLRWPDGREEVLGVPAVPEPHEHAFDESGEFFFFAYGQARVLGLERATGQRVLELELPGATWDGYGLQEERSYPARLAVVGRWLCVVSRERIHFVPFGRDAALPAQWYTCQLGTSVAPVHGGRLVVACARSGSAVFGLDPAQRRVVRLAELEPALLRGSPSGRLGHLRMALRVSGQGHDDPRAFTVEPGPEGTWVRAHGPFFTTERQLPGAHIDPAEIAHEWPTDPEIVEVYEQGGQVRLRLSPIGLDEIRTCTLSGLEELWAQAFVPRPPPPPPAQRGLYAVRAPLPEPWQAPHRDIGTLSYPEVGPTGFAFGYRVSDRPGFWNSYVVDRDGVHPLEPHWYNGVTYHAFHVDRPRLLAASGLECVEVDLASRAWRARTFPKPLRGISFFEEGCALLLSDELWLLPSFDASPSHCLPTRTREAELASFHHHQILWVPVGEEGNVFLGRRGGDLVIAGTLQARALGPALSPQGAFLQLPQGVLQLQGFEDALAGAPVWAGEPLHACQGPSVPVL